MAIILPEGYGNGIGSSIKNILMGLANRWSPQATQSRIDMERNLSNYIDPTTGKPYPDVPWQIASQINTRGVDFDQRTGRFYVRGEVPIGGMPPAKSRAPGNPNANALGSDPGGQQRALVSALIRKMMQGQDTSQPPYGAATTTPRPTPEGPPFGYSPGFARGGIAGALNELNDLIMADHGGKIPAIGSPPGVEGDVVPAKLSPGEIVLNPTVSAMFPNLNKLNKMFPNPMAHGGGYAHGGVYMPPYGSSTKGNKKRSRVEGQSSDLVNIIRAASPKMMTGGIVPQKRALLGSDRTNRVTPPQKLEEGGYAGEDTYGLYGFPSAPPPDVHIIPYSQFVRERDQWDPAPGGNAQELAEGHVTTQGQGPMVRVVPKNAPPPKKPTVAAQESRPSEPPKSSGQASSSPPSSKPAPTKTPIREPKGGIRSPRMGPRDPGIDWKYVLSADPKDAISYLQDFANRSTYGQSYSHDVTLKPGGEAAPAQNLFGQLMGQMTAAQTGQKQGLEMPAVGPTSQATAAEMELKAKSLRDILSDPAKYKDYSNFEIQQMNKQLQLLDAQIKETSERGQYYAGYNAARMGSGNRAMQFLNFQKTSTQNILNQLNSQLKTKGISPEQTANLRKQLAAQTIKYMALSNPAILDDPNLLMSLPNMVRSQRGGLFQGFKPEDVQILRPEELAKIQQELRNDPGIIAAKSVWGGSQAAPTTQDPNQQAIIDALMQFAQ